MTFTVDSQFEKDATTPNWGNRLPLISGMIRFQNLLDAEIVPQFLSEECVESFIVRAPQTVQAKLDFLVRSFHRKCRYFGHQFNITEGLDFPLGCFARPEELRFALDSLHELKLLDVARHNRDATRIDVATCAVTLKPKAYEAGLAHKTPRKVFLSSTCYDLMDIRFELAQSLESAGHIVSQSDCEERFHVDGKSDSVEMCLQNLEECDLVILIVDRRYGGLLREHESAKRNAQTLGLCAISATHLELLHAREKKKPVFCFIRDRTKLEYGSVKNGGLSERSWIQLASKDADKEDAKNAWLSMWNEIHKREDKGAHWVSTFSNSVDLRRMVTHRVNTWEPNRD